MVLDHSRDGLDNRAKEIANRLSFESRLDMRDLRNPSLDGPVTSLIVQTTSSTLRQCWRRGYAAGIRIKFLIWGKSAPLSAFASGVVLKSSPYPIDSVWRFGRDFKHSTNGENVVKSHMKYTVMNLHETRVSPKPGVGEGIEVLHAGSHIFVCVQSIRDGVEVVHKGLL